ncbi:MAG: alpha/beta hydrolase [Pseudomonadota bacterium]
MATPLRFTLVCMLVLAAACNADSPSQGQAVEANDEASAVERPMISTVTSSDGVPINFASYGSGATALVMVHGWTCNQRFWREQIDAFSDDYQVVTLDLGGHGESGGGRDNWTVAGFADDVVAVADALALERIVLVGHSMGGLVSLAAAAQMPERTVAVIAADSLHNAEQGYSPEQAAPMIAAYEADFGGSIGAAFSGMAGAAIDPAVGAWIVAEGQAARPDVSIALLHDYTRIDQRDFFRMAGVPIRAINAAAGGFVPPTLIETNQQFADFDATIIDGVGHFLQLEAPARFNTALAAELDALL